MIDFEEEIQRFKPSLDVDQLEDAILKVDLTDMNDGFPIPIPFRCAGKEAVFLIERCSFSPLQP